MVVLAMIDQVEIEHVQIGCDSPDDACCQEATGRIDEASKARVHEL